MLGPGALNILPCPSPSLRVTSPPPGALLLRASSPPLPCLPSEANKPELTSLGAPHLYKRPPLSSLKSKHPVLAPHHARGGKKREARRSSSCSSGCD